MPLHTKVNVLFITTARVVVNITSSAGTVNSNTCQILPQRLCSIQFECVTVVSVFFVHRNWYEFLTDYRFGIIFAKQYPSMHSTVYKLYKSDWNIHHVSIYLSMRTLATCRQVDDNDWYVTETFTGAYPSRANHISGKIFMEYRCPTPIKPAVGHEVSYTCIDFEAPWYHGKYCQALWVILLWWLNEMCLR